MNNTKKCKIYRKLKKMGFETNFNDMESVFKTMGKLIQWIKLDEEYIEQLREEWRC